MSISQPLDIPAILFLLLYPHFWERRSRFSTSEHSISSNLCRKLKYQILPIIAKLLHLTLLETPFNFVVLFPMLFLTTKKD